MKNEQGIEVLESEPRNEQRKGLEVELGDERQAN